MKVCNVNNSISHPPHPRRAVPANLPPGAFFTLMGSLYKQAFLLSALLLANFIQASEYASLSLTDKIVELRLKSNAHGKYVNELLAKGITFTSFDAINKPSLINTETSVGTQDSFIPPETHLPIIDIPEQILGDPSGNLSEESVSPFPIEEVVEEEQGLDKEVLVNPGFDTGDNKEANSEKPPTYNELYSSKVPLRRLGVLFRAISLNCVSR